MLETIAAQIDRQLLPVSGAVFYSGRAAFRAPAPVYVLGYNPGGNPTDMAADTISRHTQCVLDAPDAWSAYCDESWNGRHVGQSPLQKRMQHLLQGLGLDPRQTPASNLIFARSARAATLNADTKNLIEMCWPVHNVVLATLCPKAIVCFGADTGRYVRRRLGAKQLIDVFEERNNRKWKSHAWKTPAGLIVFGLTHPAIADWTQPDTDPSPMVQTILAAA